MAVYNTMPYLTACLDSLVGQSIGADRMEVIAVDDGSTDGSEAELDRYAEAYPDVVTVLRQPNSGGPAGPSNRALDVATGRYVYFVGADDYLGLEALERMVAAADEYGSDVLIGKMEGVNGRIVQPQMFVANEPDIDLHDSHLPWVLSNCKLFRRDLVERHKLRFPEDMRIGSDQPFTIEACVRAERISVLGDYTCYYAVLREDGGNITQGSVEIYTRLECAEHLFAFVAQLLEPGPRRDAIVHRHAKWELTKPVRESLLELDPAAQRDVCARVGALVDRHVTDEVLGLLPIKRRVRLRLAQHGQVDRLCAAIRDDAAERAYPIMLKEGRAYFAYHGFEDPELALPDGLYEITKGMRRRLTEEARTVEARRNGDTLQITVRTPFVGPDREDPAVARLTATPHGGTEAALEPAQHRLPGEQGMELIAEVSLERLAAACRNGRSRYGLKLALSAGDETYEVAVPTSVPPLRELVWYRNRPYRLTVSGDKRRRTVIDFAAVRPTRAVARRIRRVTSQLGGK
ncbi:glycosyltransferase family 2 protein [Actinomadura sp. 9N407]|uniref:glycosyltransferase family 2 protein n=1 Tax=Actinomadura sp. 9N407 TaxID=3375154 RepID=UPI00379B2542